MITYTDPNTDKPSYEGHCLETYTDHSVRIMSDVWANFYGVVVWDSETAAPKKVQLGNSEFGYEGEATLDATPEVVALYEAWKARQAAQAEEARLHAEEIAKENRAKEDEAEARAWLIERPTKGDKVVVVRGRKVAKGTVGIIRWEGGNDYGPRIGMAVEGKEKLVYTSPSNVEVIFPGLQPGETPEGGWAALAHRLRSERTFPVKGDQVRNAEGVTGVVFWVDKGNGSRLGFKTTPKSDPIWADTSSVVKVAEDGSTSSYVTQITAVPAGKVNPIHNDADALLAAASPASDAEAKAADEYLARKDRVAHLPPPFCDVRFIRPSEESVKWDAFGENEVLVATLPGATALHIKKLLEGETP